ncbi:MAG: hypothetical protein Q7R56_02210 [Nanoarchaeota archaeon]|nr:hypothetical protein [Nanoarchaeota archaeon]
MLPLLTLDTLFDGLEISLGRVRGSGNTVEESLMNTQRVMHDRLINQSLVALHAKEGHVVMINGLEYFPTRFDIKKGQPVHYGHGLRMHGIAADGPMRVHYFYGNGADPVPNAIGFLGALVVVFKESLPVPKVPYLGLVPQESPRRVLVISKHEGDSRNRYFSSLPCHHVPSMIFKSAAQV